MNAITQTLLWCPVQVTVLALVALGIGTSSVVDDRPPALWLRPRHWSPLLG